MARVRDYKAEYARRIARGLAAGKTRSQARGHGAEKKGAVGASREFETLKEVASYLGKLKAGRSVKVMAVYLSGRTAEIARGKAGNLRKHLKDNPEDGFEWEDKRRYKKREDEEEDEPDPVSGYQVIYS